LERLQQRRVQRPTTTMTIMTGLDVGGNPKILGFKFKKRRSKCSRELARALFLVVDMSHALDRLTLLARATYAWCQLECGLLRLACCQADDLTVSLLCIILLLAR